MDDEIKQIAKSLAKNRQPGGFNNSLDDGGPQGLNGIGGASKVNEFHICHINDFTQEQLKNEQQRYDENKTISQMLVCPAFHGGPLDYPKATTRSLGNIVSKWDLCFHKLQDVLEKERSESDNKSRGKDSVSKPTNSDEEVYERLTGKKVSHTEKKMSKAESAKRKKKKISSSSFVASDEEGEDEEPKVNEEEFYFAVAESTSKITIHCIRMIKDLLTRGDMFNLLRVLGGLCLVRNKLWYFNEVIVVDGQTKPFAEVYQEVLELVEATTEQMVQYQVTLMSTTVLHDSASQDWTNPKPFYEGERISHCVQMWWFYIQGLRSDFWSTVPPKLAQKAFAIAVDRTLGIMTVRYLHATPSPKRLGQFRGDITALLLMCSEILLYLSGAVHQLFEPHSTPFGGSQVVRSIHSKCRLLLETLAIIVSPLPVLYKTTLDCIKPKLVKSFSNDLKSNEDLTLWLHLFRPTLYHSPKSEELRPESQLVLLAKLAANQPEPIWPLIVQLTLSYDMMVARLILLHFGAFVPGCVGEAPKQTDVTYGCPGFGCQRKCLGPADQNWPQAVGSGILNVVLKGKRDVNCLIHALEGLLDKLSQNSWDALNKEQIWTHRRPVWLQAVIALLEPYILPAVLELTDLLDSGKTWTMGHVQIAVKEVLSCLGDLICVFPIALIRLCLDIESRLPRTIRPLSRSVLIHLIIACLYNVISRLQLAARREKVARERLDFLIAFGEALNNLDPDREDLLQLQVNATEVLKNETNNDLGPTDHSFEPVIYESSFVVCDMVANKILSDDQGRTALQSLHRFFCYNVDWIESCLGVSHSMSVADGSIPALIKPWGSEMFPPPSPFDMMNQIGEYRMVRVMEMSHPWDEYLRYILSPGGSLIQEQLLSRRSEYLTLAFATSDDVTMHSPTLPPDERKMLETLKELIKSGADYHRRNMLSSP